MEHDLGVPSKILLTEGEMGDFRIRSPGREGPIPEQIDLLKDFHLAMVLIVQRGKERAHAGKACRAGVTPRSPTCSPYSLEVQFPSIPCAICKNLIATRAGV